MTTLEAEQTLTFETFTHQMAYDFGEKVIRIVKEQGLKPVRIRVTYEDDIIYQYMMEGKRGAEWLDRKQRTVNETKHSSLYVFEHEADYPELTFEAGYAPCGGGFPMIINGELKGCFIVSGLAHDEDHALIVNALQLMKEEEN